MARWRKFDSLGFSCVKVEAEKEASSAGRRGHWWSRLRRSKHVQVFGVSRESADAGYRVGYRLPDGKSRVWSEKSHYLGFRVRVRREPIEVFAIIGGDRVAEDIILAKVVRTSEKDQEYAGLPLY